MVRRVNLKYAVNDKSVVFNVINDNCSEFFIEYKEVRRSDKRPGVLGRLQENICSKFEKLYSI